MPGDSRPRALAEAVGGDFRTFYDLDIQRKPLVPLRYLISAARTLAYLVRSRPRAVIMQAPPVPAAVLAWVYAKLARVPVVIDSHPVSFGFGGTAVDRAMKPLLAWLAPRSNGCIVTTNELGAEVEDWGGHPLVVHEPPPPWEDDVASSEPPRQGVVLFVCTFAADEPLDEVLDAARLLPEVRFRVTGDLRRLPARARASAPPNVEWLGYLRGGDYPRALAEADVVLTLTDRSESVPRSAYEAVYARRPLVITGWPHLAALFPSAVTVEHSCGSIAAGVRSAFDRLTELRSGADSARALQAERWDDQVAHLKRALRIPAGSAAGRAA